MTVVPVAKTLPARTLGKTHPGRRAHLVRENRMLHEQLRDRFRLDNIVGAHGSMQDVFRVVHKVASSTSTVLVYGESGTGKELVARALHHESDRRSRPFYAVNAAAPQGSPPARMYRQGPAQGQARPEALPQAQMRPQGQPRPEGPAQPQMRPQGQARPGAPAQAQMHPQGPARPPAQRQPPAVASQQGGPPREERGPHGPNDRPGER